MNRAKKYSKIIIPVIAGGIFLLLGSIFSTDSTRYSSEISSWTIDANLMENGDLHVVDTLEFKSDGFHFFEYEIGYAKNIIEGNGSSSSFDYDSIKVSVYNSKGEYYFSQASTSTSNSSDYYKYDDCLGFSWNYDDCEDGGRKLNYYTSNQPKELIYVYLHDGLDSTLYLQYEYIIKNAVNKYQDVTELNWNFASCLEDMKISNIDLTLSLPSQASSYQLVNGIDSNKIMVFGHGNSQSQITTLTSTRIKTHTDELFESIDDKLELRVIIPNQIDVFDKVNEEDMISSNRSGFEILKEEEERLANLDKELVSYYQVRKNILIYGNILASIILLFSAIFVYFKFDKERKPLFDHEYLREPPSKISPSELSYLINEKEIVTEAFNATLISLIRKKYLKIDSNNSLLTDPNANYIISINEEGPYLEEMNEDEKFAFNFLFKQLFKGSFSMEDLEKAMKNVNVASSYTTSINNWKRQSKNRAHAKNYFDNISVSSLFTILGGISIGVSIYSLFNIYLPFLFPYPYLFLLLTSFVLGVFIIVYTLTITRKSKSGIEEYTKWMAFKKFLIDFSHFEDYDMMSVIMWEEYLVYASVFGIADLVEKQIRIKLKDYGDLEQVQPSANIDLMDLYLIIHINNVSRRFSSSYTAAINTIVAQKAAQAGRSISRGGGGFGSSSSFGGGGHGGRAG